MPPIDLDSVADIYFQLQWQSPAATHTEGYAARNVNLWRDWLPAAVQEALAGREPLEQIQVELPAGALFGSHTAPIPIDRKQFGLVPRAGRFYPRGRLRGLPGVFPQNMQPFRCVGINNGHLQAAMGHPLATYALNLSMTVGQVADKQDERGGSSTDWVGLLTEGPGMQARWTDLATDFFSDRPFERRDEQADTDFYAKPRLAHHLDRTAREMVADLYQRFVADGMRVLDLMSSWRSHLPEEVRPMAVSGLGLNRIELEANPHLTDVKVHDLNADPTLPYGDESFDVVLCSLSIEYLTHPRAVFAEVARVLRPGGTFVVCFSNRWFPPKTIRVWEELHEFERLGLVLEYFLESGAFEQLKTRSMRGLPRPADDRYAGERPFSDPLYAAWGVRKASA